MITPRAKAEGTASVPSAFDATNRVKTLIGEIKISVFAPPNSKTEPTPASGENVIDAEVLSDAPRSPIWKPSPRRDS